MSRIDEAALRFQAAQLVFPKEAVDLILEKVRRWIVLAAGRRSAKLFRSSCEGYFEPCVGRHVVVKQPLPLTRIRAA